jgi:hypothetical protein
VDNALAVASLKYLSMDARIVRRLIASGNG